MNDLILLAQKAIDNDNMEEYERIQEKVREEIRKECISWNVERMDFGENSSLKIEYVVLYHKFINVIIYHVSYK